MAVKLRLSRENMYVPITDMDFVLDDLIVNAIAFMGAGEEPEEADWHVATVVDVGDPLYDADIGPSLVVLVGPDRGDAVTTIDLAVADYQVWVDMSVTGSDERVVRIAGDLEVPLTV